MARESLEKKRARAREIVRRLGEEFPGARTELDFRTPFQLLVATILAAQSTDVTVNKVTPGLFEKYPDPQAFARAAQEELEKDIHATGFFRQKSRSIIEASRDLVERFGGEVPDTMEALTSLRGVGRKTANVLLASAFGKPSIIVDTHVKRCAGRLGLTAEEDPTKIEFDLQRILPEGDWSQFSHTLVLHGRYVCLARKPKCPECPLSAVCPSREKTRGPAAKPGKTPKRRT